jgi:FtsP/CotA-like multicopper oxidase with cupredoxin domain
MGAGAAAAASAGWSRLLQSELPDVELSLSASSATAGVIEGAATRVWRYDARLLRGPAHAVQPVTDSYLGPTVRMERGQRLRVQFANGLPEPTVVHWHGLDVPEAADGHPRFMIGSGGRSASEFAVVNRAGTYWYHPHHHHRTGFQVYQGLAGLFLVSDPEERALDLPSGAREIVCVIQDRTFDRANQLAYLSGTPMDQMTGFFGERVLVNGRPSPQLQLAEGVYRLRLLNGSNARTYKLAWSDGTPMTLIGTDGGLLERAVEKPYLTFAPGERADVILDVRARAVGSTFELRSVAFPGAPFVMSMGPGRFAGRGRGRAMTMSAAPGPGAPLTVMSCRVTAQKSSTFRLPERLCRFDSAWIPGLSAPPTRRISVDFAQMHWLLDGRTFEMAGPAPAETVRAGSTAIWEFDNTGPSMMGRLAHPLHLHGRQFRVLSREIEPAHAALREPFELGLMDEGWKDTVLVFPGERVRLLIRFSDYPGLFLYHCHNLEHEDMGMMRNYRISPRA